MKIKFEVRSLDDFKKLAKKAAHKYAMHVVVSPLANKKAVSEVEQAFYAGAIGYREVMDTYRATRILPPHLDEIKKQAFDKYFYENFGDNQSEETKNVFIKIVCKGVGWGIDNYDKLVTDIEMLSIK